MVVVGSVWPPGDCLVTAEGWDVQALPLLSQVPVAAAGSPASPRARATCVQNVPARCGRQDTTYVGVPRALRVAPGRRPVECSCLPLPLADSLQTRLAVPGF